MSMESAQLFMEKMRTDTEFAAKAEGCQTIDELVTFAQQAGYDFSADEAQAVPDDVSDAALEAVSGGRYVRKIP